ncbi:PREDICTED: endothelin-converting enzyme 1-like [Rhagoletis zephyria]|uniref:endothelin-converting enzyme 1-like n=1 Tax=Rhagoletis zephyria TaxID=28612 RepID=UPI000811A960|nr:PREDICTED: endothelin-converting enzyme 1-like [Rhagoletis zephyria]
MFAEETCNTTACKLASVSILSQLNRTFDPCTDFYSHVCGNYPAHHPLDNNEWTNSFSERQKLVIKEIDEAFLNAKSKSKSKSIHFVSEYYSDCMNAQEEKTKATNMVNEIRSSFRINLQTNNWLDSETAKHAIEKLDAIQHFVGFDEWILSDELIDKHSNVIQNNETYQKGKFLETFINFSVRSRKDNLENHPPYQDPKLRNFVNPLIVNAFYSRSINSIFIPAAILQPPFFDHELPWSANYGSIGAIIGHELTHGFDAEGRKYDLHGNFSNWWTNATLTKFLNKTKCIQEQYGQIHDPVADKNINGVQTLSENIADNGAIKNSYAAYQAHLKKYKDAKVLPNLSYNSEQLFFVFYGNLWCENISAKRLRALIGGDGHSPNKYRTNVVLGNFEPFAKAFNCPLGSKMNPTSKCSVW